MQIAARYRAVPEYDGPDNGRRIEVDHVPRAGNDTERVARPEQCGRSLDHDRRGEEIRVPEHHLDRNRGPRPSRDEVEPGQLGHESAHRGVQVGEDARKPVGTVGAHDRESGTAELRAVGSASFEASKVPEERRPQPELRWRLPRTGSPLDALRHQRRPVGLRPRAPAGSVVGRPCRGQPMKATPPAGLAAGSQIRNVLPDPEMLSTAIVPPCASTSPFVMNRPRPRPRRLARARCAWKYRSKSPRGTRMGKAEH